MDFTLRRVATLLTLVLLAAPVIVAPFVAQAHSSDPITFPYFGGLSDPANPLISCKGSYDISVPTLAPIKDAATGAVCTADDDGGTCQRTTFGGSPCSKEDARTNPYCTWRQCSNANMCYGCTGDPARDKGNNVCQTSEVKKKLAAGACTCNTSIQTTQFATQYATDMPSCTSFCDIVHTGQHILYFLISVMVFIIIPVALFIGGALYLVSGGNPKLKEQGKNVIKAGAYGALLTLGAFVIVNLMLYVIFQASFDEGLRNRINEINQNGTDAEKAGLPQLPKLFSWSNINCTVADGQVSTDGQLQTYTQGSCENVCKADPNSKPSLSTAGACTCTYTNGTVWFDSTKGGRVSGVPQPGGGCTSPPAAWDAWGYKKGETASGVCKDACGSNEIMAPKCATGNKQCCIPRKNNIPGAGAQCAIKPTQDWEGYKAGTTITGKCAKSCGSSEIGLPGGVACGDYQCCLPKKKK